MMLALPMAAEPDAPALTCEGCGACCLHMAVPPFDEDELELLRVNLPHLYAEMQAIFQTRALQFKLCGTDHIPCAWFDWVTRKCKHHEHNPDVCHRFEVGDVSCLAIREDAGL
jgi:Fe-S-cluster containining protein